VGQTPAEARVVTNAPGRGASVESWPGRSP
jgi:hypothetical protein